jgi:hypothetical protein
MLDQEVDAELAQIGFEELSPKSLHAWAVAGRGTCDRIHLISLRCLSQVGLFNPAGPLCTNPLLHLTSLIVLAAADNSALCSESAIYRRRARDGLAILG